MIPKHPGMSIKRTIVKDKKGRPVIVTFCAKNGTHEAVLKRVVRGNR